MVSCGQPASFSSSLPEYTDRVNVQGEYETELRESDDTGSYIGGVKAYASSSMYKAEHSIDCSGMSGGESYLHLHTASSPRETMYMSQANRDKNDLIFQFPSVLSVGKMFIWNYNNFARIDCSVKEFSVEYSSDGVTFSPFEDAKIFTLEQESGYEDIGSSSVDGREFLDLKGICTRYIRLSFISNYGGNSFGLSEVRFYQYKMKARTGNPIQANIFREKGKRNVAPEAETMLYGGLSDLDSLTARSTSNPFFMYASKYDEITFTLNGSYPLKEIGIWNYNDPSALQNGVKELRISFSVDGYRFTDDKTVTVPEGTGADGMEVSAIIACENMRAQYVRLKFLSNYGGKLFGLSAIRFIAGSGRVTEPHPIYTGMFSSYSGWTGSDGIFNVRLNGDQSIGSTGKSVFNFSDTYVGTVDPVTKMRKDYIFKNNSFGLYDGEKEIEFLTGDFLPLQPEKDENRSPADAYYWLGDSFVVGNAYYVSALYMAKEGALGFAQRGEDLIRFEIVDGKIDFSSHRIIKDESTDRLSYFDPDGSLDIIFGSGIFENTVASGSLNPDGYIYNYGYRDDRGANGNTRSLVVARVKEDQVEDFDAYTYFTGSGWENDIRKARGLTQEVSCEMSVVEINDPNSEYYGKYLLTYQKNTVSNEICIKVSDRLTDFSGSSFTIYSTPEILSRDGVSQYNAKMHPTLSDPNRLIVSYNLNEAQNGVNALDGDVYHPRFLSLFYI